MLVFIGPTDIVVLEKKWKLNDPKKYKQRMIHKIVLGSCH